MSAPVLMITRAQPGASETATRLTDLGFRVVVSPVLELVAQPEVRLPGPALSSGLIFTSANGVRFFCDRRQDRSLTAWCVGPATAAAACAAGFRHVEESAGNAEDLARFIDQKAPPAETPLLHIANAAARGNLLRRLKASGREVEFCPIYRANTAPALTPAAIRALKDRGPAVLLLHSAKGADAFLTLSADLPRRHLRVAAISEAAARAPRDEGMRSVAIAPTPTEEGLLEAIKEAIATLSA